MASQQLDTSPERGTVDPRAPRVGQGIVAGTLLLGIVLQEPLLVYLIAGTLLIAVLSRWRIDPFALVWRYGLRYLVSPPPHREDPSPHRFAKLVGASLTVIASLAILGGMPLLGYVAAAVVATLAALSAITGFCLGCRMYEEVALARRTGLV